APKARVARRRKAAVRKLSVEALEDRTLLSSAPHLVFGQEPTDTVVGSTINPPVSVRVEDAAGNSISSISPDVSVSIQDNPGGGALNGTNTAAAAAGVATFDDLSIDQAGTGYTLVASALVPNQAPTNMGVTFQTSSGLVSREIPVEAYRWAGKSG